MRFSLCKILLAFSFLLLLTTFLIAQTHREKGIELYESGDYKAAVEMLQKAVEVGENDGEAWRFLGMAFAKTDDKKQD